MDKKPQSKQQLEVLNISNETSEKLLALNDEKLLELVQEYPFLYNPRVQPYKDPDFDEWAWDSIARDFNRSYTKESLKDRGDFTVAELRARWEVLQPIILRLSKAYNLSDIPSPLRLHVINISKELLDTTPAKPLSKVQQLVLDQLPWVEKLPLNTLKEMHAEIMDIILQTELEGCADIKPKDVDPKLVRNDCNEFFKAAGLDHLRLPETDDEDKQPSSSKRSAQAQQAATDCKKKRVDLADAHRYVKPLEVRLKRLPDHKFKPALERFRNYRTQKALYDTSDEEDDDDELDDVPLLMIKKELTQLRSD